MNKESLIGRLEGLWHILRGHDVEWQWGQSTVCPGDIVCHTCHITIWCRVYD